MSDYQARITETADGSFYAMVVLVDDDVKAKFLPKEKSGIDRLLDCLSVVGLGGESHLSLAIN